MSSGRRLSRVSFANDGFDGNLCQDAKLEIKPLQIHPFREEVTVDQPILQMTKKIGVCIISPKGKESSTTFKKLSFNGTSSLVHCFPKSGRMHQIRLHLQYLGHPIINDPLYNSFAFGPEKGKGARYGKTMDEVRVCRKCSDLVSQRFIAVRCRNQRTCHRTLDPARGLLTADNCEVGL